MPKPSPWYVYLAEADDGRIYTGVALDPVARCRQHGGRKGAKCLRGRQVRLLAVLGKHPTKGPALRHEYRIKRMPRVKKLLQPLLGDFCTLQKYPPP